MGRVFETLERLEDALARLARDSDSVVSNPRTDDIAVLFGPDAHSRIDSRSHVLQGVRDEIDECLDERRPVPQNFERRGVDANLRGARARGGLDLARRVRDDAGDRDRFESRLESAGATELEEILDQSVHALCRRQDSPGVRSCARIEVGRAFLGQETGEPEDGLEGDAQVVTHGVGEGLEPRIDLTQLGRSLGDAVLQRSSVLAHLGEELCSDDRPRRELGELQKEGLVRLVEVAPLRTEDLQEADVHPVLPREGSGEPATHRVAVRRAMGATGGEVSVHLLRASPERSTRLARDRGELAALRDLAAPRRCGRETLHPGGPSGHSREGLPRLQHLARLRRDGVEDDVGRCLAVDLQRDLRELRENSVACPGPFSDGEGRTARGRHPTHSEDAFPAESVRPSMEVSSAETRPRLSRARSLARRVANGVQRRTGDRGSSPSAAR